MWLISKAMMDNLENSPYSQGPEGESLEASCLDGEPSAQLSGSHTQLAYLPPDKMMAFSRLSRSGMTFRPLTESRGAELLMLFQAGFPVRTSAQQERAQESREVDQACGSTWHESSVKYDLDSHSWRTANSLLSEDLPWSSVTLPRSGMVASGQCFMLPPLEGSMYARDYSYLPTPTAHNAKEGAYPAEYTRRTPSLATHAGGKINPEWTEHLMGWPLGWTDLKPLGTVKYQSWQQQHSIFCLPNQEQNDPGEK